MASKDEATAGLISLGYSLHDAAIALKEVDKDLSTEERIKAALKKVWKLHQVSEFRASKKEITLYLIIYGNRTNC